MKKLVSVLLLIVLAACVLVSCGDKGDAYVVGICNYVDDASLNQIVDNITAQLQVVAAQKGISIKIKVQNCQADANVMNQIIANFIADDVDVMIGIATPVAMAMQAATEDNGIPVVFAAVSDPLSVGLVDSLDAPGHNITGTSDFLNTEAILQLMLSIDAKLDKVVGLLYDIGQDSSTSAIEAAKAFLNAHGIAYVEKNGISVSEIQQAANELIAAGVDAVFTPTDNSIMKAELSIYEAFAEAGVPHYAGADSFALNGAFVGYGVDYANLGVETANMVAEILFDKKSPAAMPVKTFDNGTATVNTDICAALGYDYNAVEAAFAPYCTKVVTIITAESFDDIQ